MEIASETDGPPNHNPSPSETSRRALPPVSVLRYWEAASDPTSEKPPLKRVYVEMPGYPAFFGQRSSKKLDGRSGTIVWGSSSEKVGHLGARSLAHRAFNPVPSFFWELERMVPGHVPTERPIPHLPDSDGMNPLDDPAPVSAEEMRMLPCAYGRADTMALDPSRLQHPIPSTVTMLVDRRQPSRLVEALRRVVNLEIVETDLSHADFVVEGRMIIRRKSNGAFHESLADKGSSLIKEAEAMSETGLHRILLIEGGPYARRQFVLNRLASTLSYVQNVHGIHVTPTMNERHSLYVIVQAVKHHLFGMFSDPVEPKPVSAGGSMVEPTSCSTSMLRHVPGVSEERAKALMLAFGSIAGIACADEASLKTVPGIGRKTASMIWKAMHADGIAVGERTST